MLIVPAADYYQQEELHSEAAMMVDHREKNEGAIVSFYTAIQKMLMVDGERTWRDNWRNNYY